MQQKITPFLWFDDQAEEAVEFYTSLFDDSRVTNVARYGPAGPGPEGSAMTVSFELAGQAFTALNGGPEFDFTPAISFFVSCATEAEVDALWAAMSEGGTTLMPLVNYPFSEKFGWVNDKYGVSWQLNLAPRAQKITPFLMFVGEQQGRAEEAINLYISLFEDSSVENIVYHTGQEGETAGTVQHAVFSLHGQDFMAMDSAQEHNFTFNEAVSLYVNCESQAEVNRLWEALTADGGEESQCGWLKDRFGLSWQIIPNALIELMGDEDAGKAQRVTEAMLQMRKIDIAGLQAAYDGA
jgi:predicted 3-demethylubiquinone-9 3-methyltransferase (glyoxalase superfamily)